MKPMSEAWCLVKEGCGTALEVKLLSQSEDVSVDGHRLANKSTSGNMFDGARRSYLLHTWYGGAEVQFDPNVVEVVRADYQAVTYPLLLNADNINKVLVVDDSSSTGITTANYCYSLPTKSYPDSKINTRRWLTTTTYIDLTAAGNHGAVNVYPMTHGTIPPHHPADFIPELKQGVYVGTESDDLVTFVGQFVADIKGRVVCFMDYTRYSPKIITNVMEVGGFDACYTTSDLVAHEVKKKGSHVLKLPPRISGVPRDLYVPTEDMSEVVKRHVFMNPCAAPHHVKIDEKLSERVYAPIEESLRVKGSSNRLIKTGKFTAFTAYLMVHEENKNTYTVWGLAYCDNNRHLHSLFDEKMCSTLFMFIKLGYCVIE